MSGAGRTTRVGGIPEIFGPHADQLLAPGDAEALARAMLTVLENPAAARQRAEGVREHVRAHLRVADMVRATIEFYQEVTGPAPVALARPGVAS